MNPHNQERGFFNFYFLASLVGALFFVFALGYFFYGLEPSFATKESVKFQIMKGDSFRAIGARLSQSSLVRSISVFKIYSLMSGKAQKFQPGIYELSGTMNVPEIVAILTIGGRDEATATIPEGVTIKDIDRILAAADIIQANALVNFSFEKLKATHPFLVNASSLEGFIFPDTYRFKIHSSPETVVIRILENFNAKAWPILQGQKNWYDYLILASLLEREVPDFNDRQVVSGILLKRLKLGIPLQVDATISYAKCDGEFRNCTNIRTTRTDLSLDSSYNTYKHLGLPPTPIANAGQSALKAATTPKTSPYLYYLSASKDKETIFSKTLEEHNFNRAKYL